MPFKFLTIALVAICAVSTTPRAATAQNWNQILTASLPTAMNRADPGCMTGANAIAAMIAMKQNSPQLTDDWIKSNAYLFNKASAISADQITYADDHASWLPDVARLDYWIRCQKRG